MDLTSRIGQVWILNDGDSVELIVRGIAPVGRINEVRWETLVLWCRDDPFNTRPAGAFDQVGEEALLGAEAEEDTNYRDWTRIT